MVVDAGMLCFLAIGWSSRSGSRRSSCLVEICRSFEACGAHQECASLRKEKPCGTATAEPDLLPKAPAPAFPNKDLAAVSDLRGCVVTSAVAMRGVSATKRH